MSDWASALTSNDYSISGDAASAQIVAMQVTTGNPDVLANGSDRHTVNVRVEDQFGNVLPGADRHLYGDEGGGCICQCGAERRYQDGCAWYGRG